MNVNERDMSILRHILNYCQQINETIDHFGDDQEIFRQSFIYQNAVALCMLQIGELAGNLSDEYRQTHTGMPWRQIRALRNIIAHNYGSVDHDIAWEIAHADIATLREYCLQELEPSKLPS